MWESSVLPTGYGVERIFRQTLEENKGLDWMVLLELRILAAVFEVDPCYRQCDTEKCGLK